MGNHSSVLEKAGSVRMIRVIVGIHYIPNGRFVSFFNKVNDLASFNREWQRVNYNSACTGQDGSCRDLGIKFTRENIDIVGNAFTQHTFVLRKKGSISE
jgi:hypothetical protein